MLLPPGPPAAPLVTEGTEFTFVMLLIFVGCAVVFACLWGACLYSLVYVLMPKWRQRRQVHALELAEAEAKLAEEAPAPRVWLKPTLRFVSIEVPGAAAPEMTPVVAIGLREHQPGATDDEGGASSEAPTDLVNVDGVGEEAPKGSASLGAVDAAPVDAKQKVEGEGEGERAAVSAEDPPAQRPAKKKGPPPPDALESICCIS